MTSELNLSVGKSPRIFVRLDGWNDSQIAELAHHVHKVFGVVSAAPSAGSGMYVEYDDASIDDADLKSRIRAIAIDMMPGRLGPN